MLGIFIGLQLLIFFFFVIKPPIGHHPHLTLPALFQSVTRRARGRYSKRERLHRPSSMNSGERSVSLDSAVPLGREPIEVGGECART